MKMERALVVGGSNGLGLSIALSLKKKGYKQIIVLDQQEPDVLIKREVEFVRFNLLFDDYSVFETFDAIDTLIITAGIGRIASFENIEDVEIQNCIKINSLAPMRIISKFYDKLIQNNPFFSAVVGSIAGLVSSPLFSVYGASKAAVCKFTESINIELEKKGTPNRILNVIPGFIEGTRFYGQSETNLGCVEQLADEITDKMFARETVFIPKYSMYKSVLERYHSDPHRFGLESYKYKEESGRLSSKPRIKVGYLSGTFDLFHIGHLNLIRRAKEYCDYLVVGVHKDASHKNKTVFIPYEERVEIVKSVRYVDKVIESLPEDSDVYAAIKYDYLFVGSDYKGSDRFRKYEDYFKDKNVKIVYFPYTRETSSTHLRITIDNFGRQFNGDAFDR